MSRSKWKGLFVENDLNVLSIPVTKVIDYEKNLRNSSILSRFIGCSFDISNGKYVIPLIITTEMVGHKFGEFHASTKVGVIKRPKEKMKNRKLRKAPRKLKYKKPRTLFGGSRAHRTRNRNRKHY